MKVYKKSLTSILIAATSLGLMLQSVGCASGGYKLTRKYSSWVNNLHIVPRIVVYILTGVIYSVTMLIDLIIFNTADFWQGRVSAGNYQFEGEGKRFLVEHSFHGSEESLKKSKIAVYSKENDKKLQDILLLETKNSNIEVFVDGKKKAEVKDINDIPQLVSYDKNGKTESIKDMMNLLAGQKKLALK